MNKFVLPGKVKQAKNSIVTPEDAGLRFVVTLCSDDGSFESPLQQKLNKRWARVRQDYKGWYVERANFKMGNLLTSAVNSDTWVVHMLCLNKDKELDDKALNSCMKKLADMAKYENASAHISKELTEAFPKFAELLKDYITSNGINLYFYDT
jgi:hypothetical protein